MKRIMICALIVALVLSSVPFIMPSAQAGNLIFTSDRKVNDDAGSGEQTAVDMCHRHTTGPDQDILYAVWQDQRSGNRDIYFSRSLDCGTTWQANVRVDDAPSGDQTSPAIAVDSSGNIFVVWVDDRNGDGHIYITNSSDGGLTFDTSTLIDDSGVSGVDHASPDIAVTSSDKIIVVWADKRPSTNRDIYLATSTDGKAFTADLRVDDAPASTNQENPAVDTYLNNVYVIWDDERTGNYNIRIKKSTDGGATFPSASVDINADDLSGLKQSDGTISIDELGSIYVAWSDFRTSNYNVNMAVSTNGGSTFSAYRNVDAGPSGTAQYTPNIYALNSTVIYCVWTDTRGDSTENIYLAASWDGGVTWGNQTQVDQAGASTIQILPVVCTNATGEAQVVWVDNRNTNRDIYFATMSYYVPPVNSDPTMSQTNITPLSGCPDTVFTFKVRYFDAEGDLPAAGYPRLYVYEDSAGTTPYGTGNYTMLEKSVIDTNVIDGKDYQTTLTYGAEKNFTYRYAIKSSANAPIIQSPLLFGPVIDATPVTFSNATPDNSTWLTRADITFNITLSDTGSGVNGSLIKYRYSKNGVDNISRWYSKTRTSAPQINMSEKILLGEGDQNYVQWNATDVAGNDPVFSDYYNLKIDMTEVSFHDPSHAIGATVTYPTVNFEINVSDTDSEKLANNTNVSGIDPASLQFRFRSASDSLWRAWDANVTVMSQTEEAWRVRAVVSNLSKGSNLVQFRARDLAGNGESAGYTNSLEYSLNYAGLANSPPTPPSWINPNSTTDTTPHLSWGPGFDLDGDNLTYFLQVGTSTQKDYILPWASMGPNRYYDIIAELKKGTTYLVQLKVFDGKAYSGIFETNLAITTTGNVPPSTPTGITPTVTQSLIPTITWSPSTDPDSINIMYFIRIGTGPSLGDVLDWTQVLTGTSYATSVYLGLDYGVYYIQLQAFDGTDYSDTALSTLKIGYFEIGVADFTTDLYVGDVATYNLDLTNLGSGADNVRVMLNGTVFTAAKIFVEDTEYVLSTDPGRSLSFVANETKRLRVQFRVQSTASASTYSFLVTVISEDGSESGKLEKLDVVIKTKDVTDDDVVNVTDDDDDLGHLGDMARKYWWLGLIFVVVIFIIIIVAMASSSRKKKKEEEHNKKQDYDRVYSQRDQGVEYAPRQQPQAPPPQQQPRYPARASPIMTPNYYDQAPPQAPSPSPVDTGEFEPIKAESSDYQPLEYEEPVEEQVVVAPPVEEEDEGPKDIYGYDEEEKAEADAIAAKARGKDTQASKGAQGKGPKDESKAGSDGSYLNIDDM